MEYSTALCTSESMLVPFFARSDSSLGYTNSKKHTTIRNCYRDNCTNSTEKL